MRKDLLQLGVQSPLRVAGVLLDPGKVCAVRRLGLTPGFALDLRTGWDLNDPAHRAKVWSHLQQERPILMVGNWSGADSKLTHMRCMKDAHRREVSQGPFFVHEKKWNGAYERRAWCDEIGGAGVSG